jgi:hypothetical protein
MRRFAFVLALLGVTALATSAFAQDTTKRDTTPQRVHRRVRVTSRGDVDTSLRKPPAVEDTSKIRAPSKHDSALVRREIRADTSSVARDTSVRPHTPPPPPPPPH